MNALKIKENIYWVGAIDWNLKNFHGYLTQRGSTYNAYLIIDEKIILIDTVKHHFYDEMLTRVKSVTDPSKIDYIVSNHVEMDHSGSLPRITQLCPKAVIITSPNGEKGLKKHYDLNLNLKTVNTGDSINIGKRDIQFVLTQMVHWPDSMASYIPQDKLLLPNDAFGQHIASEERFDDELNTDTVMHEAAKYYANIVLPYGNQVKKALDSISNLDINMIAPSHGIIWRQHIKEIINKYQKWSGNETEEKAVIIYDTMWESTKKIAQTIHSAFKDKNISSVLLNLKETHISDIMTHLMSAKYICVGSPTLNNEILPTAAAFTTYMKGLAPKNRIWLAFGSYGWGGQSINQINEILKSCGFSTMDQIKIQYVPTEKDLNDIKEKLKGGL